MSDDLPKGVLDPCRGWGGAGVNRPLSDCVETVAIINASNGLPAPMMILNGRVLNGILKTDKYSASKAYVVTKDEIREVE